MNKLGMILISSSIAFLGCTKNSEKDFSQELIHPLGGDQVILEYKGGSITAKEVEEKMNPQFARVREQLLNAYIKAAEDSLIEREAKKFATENESVSNIELENYMHANNLPKSEVEKVRMFLASEKNRINKQINKMKVFNDLEVKNKLGAARYDLEATSDLPSKGGRSAKVTVQLFCDFGNPICNRVRILMGETLNEFGDKVRWIYRHFPVASNGIGEEATRVAMCAHEQDLFWPVHDRFFDQQATLNKDNLVKVAIEVGVNSQKLSACLQSAESKNKMSEEMKAGNALGLTQTPAFFVNGTKINDLEQVRPYIASQVKK